MGLTLLQSAAITLAVLAVAFLLFGYLSTREHEVGFKRYAAFMVVLFGITLFTSINLYSASKYDVRLKEVVDKYGRTSTIELIALLRSDSTVEIGEGKIVFNHGTDDEKVFIVLHDPVFTIMDQSKLIEMQRELYPDE